MSDFLFSTRRRDPGALEAALRAYLAPVAEEIRERHGDWGSLAVLRGRHDAPDVLMEDPSGLSVLLGEPRIDLPGGAPRRALHDALLAGGERRWDAHLDGMWAAFAVGGGTWRAATDRFGFIPLYQGGEVVGSHPDAVALAAGVLERIDPVSAADLYLNLTCTVPYTLYEGVRQLPAASVRTGGEGGDRRYWAPEESEHYPTLRAAAGVLREGIVADVRAVCAAAGGRVGVLLSGGEDSRALLGAVPAGSQVTTFTFADSLNREARAARRVASAYGAGWVFGERSPTHYEDGMPAAAALVGSLHLWTDVHALGLHRTLGLDRLPVVLGGLSADSLLKAVYSPRSERAGERHRYAAPAAGGVRPELVAAVVERREAFLASLRELRPRSAGEWSVLWPFSMRKHGANVHGNRRLFASHETYHCNAALDVAAAAPVAWKRDRRLFVQAVRPLLARSWHVPHARSRFPYFGRRPNLVLGAGLRAARLVRDAATGSLRTRQGPWPKWSTLATSPAAGLLWARYPIEPTPLAGLFGAADPRGSIAGVHPLRQLMLLQLSRLVSREEVG